MDIYDKEMNHKKLRQKIVGAYMRVYLLLFALLALNVWLGLDLAKQNIDLLQQTGLLCAKGIWGVFWTYSIVTAVWFLLGSILKLFEYRSVYPFVGVCGLNAVFLFQINTHAWLQCKQVWATIYGFVSPVLFWILFAVAVLVLVAVFFERILMAIFDCLEIFYDVVALITKVVVFFACGILYSVAFSKLLALQSVWVFGGGTAALAGLLYFLWNKFITKDKVVQEDMVQNRKKSANIVLRILKDIALGMVASLLIFFAVSALHTAVLEKWTALANVKIIDFDIQEIFFTELSLVFLVISFVTLLANKTDAVYWVDVIQYRLIKPNHSSIVDISSYIFANLLLSLIAFVFPALADMMIVSFVLTIILLGFLSIKLLISFFGVEHLKEELREEYQMALEYRRLICHMQYEVENPLNFLIFYHGRDWSPYAEMPVGEFGSRHPMDTVELQNLHDELLWGKAKKGNGWKKKGTYKKLSHYAKKFNYKVDAFEDMRDGLYSNIIKCIAEYKVSETCEQILFLLQYKEYEYAMDCMERVIEQYPLVFLEMFNDSLDDIDRDQEIVKFFNEKLAALLSDEKKRGQLSKTKCEIAINCMANWVSGYVSGYKLENQLYKAIEAKDALLVSKTYKAGYLNPVCKMIAEEAKRMQKLRYRNEEICWEGKLGNALKPETGDGLIVKLLEDNLTTSAYKSLKEYKHFLDTLIAELNKLYSKGEVYLQSGVAIEMQICNLANIFAAAKGKYDQREGEMSEKTLIAFVKLIGDCYVCLKMLYTIGYRKAPYPAKLQAYQKELAVDIVKFLQPIEFENKSKLLHMFDYKPEKVQEQAAK